MTVLQNDYLLRMDPEVHLQDVFAHIHLNVLGTLTHLL